MCHSTSCPTSFSHHLMNIIEAGIFYYPYTHIKYGTAVNVHCNGGQTQLNLLIDGPNKAGWLYRELWCYQSLRLPINKWGAIVIMCTVSYGNKPYKQNCPIIIYYATHLDFLLYVHARTDVTKMMKKHPTCSAYISFNFWNIKSKNTVHPDTFIECNSVVFVCWLFRE